MIAKTASRNIAAKAGKMSEAVLVLERRKARSRAVIVFIIRFFKSSEL